MPSGDNRLAGITVSGYVLSPPFRADLTAYVVWLPYETDHIQVSGKAAHANARVQVSGGSDLAAGQDTPVTLVCTAENGETKTYTVVAKRAAPHDGAVPSRTQPPTEASVPETTGTSTSEAEKPGAAGTPIVWLLLPAGLLAGFALGFGAAFLLRCKKA